MKRLADIFMVIALGLLSTLSTAFLIGLTGFNLLSFSLWFVIPIGAALTGMLAASGYYLGARYRRERASKILFLSVLLTSTLCVFLVYYLFYSRAVLPGGQTLSSVLSFSRYLQISATRGHVYLYGGDLGSARSLGYGILLLQVAGTMAGGLGVITRLSQIPSCEQCAKPLQLFGGSKQYFYDRDALSKYHDTLVRLPHESPEFARMVGTRHKAKIEDGAWRLEMKLFGCSECRRQVLEKEICARENGRWMTHPDLKKRTVLATSIDLTGAFQAKD